MTKARLAGATAAACVAFLAFTAPSYAQFANSDYGWSAWHGCWRADGAPARELLCIVPEGDAVRMITIVDGVSRDESRVVADDRAREVVQDDCRGTQRARWSNDHRRVFLNSELTCGDLRRVSSGMLAFTDENHWVSVQSVTIDGQTATRTTRYAIAPSASVPANVFDALRGDLSSRNTARAIAAANVTGEDVDEAAANIDDAAVQEWLHASGWSDDVASGSALDQLDRGYGETRVIERPVYVERTYVTNVVRCWDPFFGGFVIGGRHVAVGVGVSSGCGYRYYTRYSPWGYDLYGWRLYRPVVFVNRYPRYYPSRPVIIHRGPSHYSDRDSRYRDSRYRNPRNYRDDGNYRDNRDRRDAGDHLRLTRGGYTDSRSGASSQPPRASQPARISSPPPRSSQPARVTTTGRVAQPRDRAARQPQPQPARAAVSRDRRER